MEAKIVDLDEGNRVMDEDVAFMMAMYDLNEREARCWVNMCKSSFGSLATVIYYRDGSKIEMREYIENNKRIFRWAA